MRTMKTAEAVNHGNLPIITDAGLKEINGGVWEGTPYARLPDLYPESARDWNIAPWNFNPENGESMRSVYERIYGTVLRIVSENEGKTIAIASHGCAIRNLFCRLNGMPIESLNEIIWCDNTGVSLVEFDCDMNPKIHFQFDISHLDEDLSTLGKQVWWKKENRENLVFE